MLYSILVILGVLFIAYWWGNQGLFSSLLHLVCVITAGAIAFAFWEPLTTKLLNGSKFDAYLWGITLVGLFTVSLFVLRVAADRLVPSNVQLPQWANLVFGGILGLGSGVLTIGILVIGIGFVQSSNKLAGLRGWQRSSQTGQVGTNPQNTMLFPVHSYTAGFYEMLSVGSLKTGTSLKHYYPELDRQAVSLIRDTYRDGRGMISIDPDAVSITRLVYDASSGRYGIAVNFTSKARDFAEQLTISQSQVRLITEPINGDPEVYLPDRWIQDGNEFLFDSASHFATSTPGQENAALMFQFRLPEGRRPRFVQIKGSRFRLPAEEDGSVGSGTELSGNTPTPTTTSLGGNIGPMIEINEGIRPIQISKNMLGGNMKATGDFLSSGRYEHRRGGPRPSNNLRIKGIYEPAGTRVVKLDVSRNGPADIFGEARQQAGDGARIALVDSKGRTYSPIGYIHQKPGGEATIVLDPENSVATLDDLPIPPSSGAETLRLIFTITVGADITSLRFGDVTIGSCNVPVIARST